MLLSLFIKNILLIKEINIDFSEGLCVITGETGAGKSILLNSILFCLGQKTKIQKTNLIRPGEKIGEVSCIFDISKSSVALQMLEENNINTNPDNTIVIRRLVNEEGKSKIFINNTVVGLAFLTSFGEIIFEFHTQSQQSKLANESNHDSFLIQYGNLQSILKNVNDVYHKIKNLELKIKENEDIIQNLKREYEYNIESLKEIKSIDIKENEELELIEKRTNIKNSEKEFNALTEITKKLNNNTFRNLISSSIRTASITNHDSIKQKLDDMLNLYDEFDFEIQKALNNTSFNESLLEKIDDRIHIIRDIARKHKISTCDIIKFVQELEQKVKQVQANDGQVNQYKQELSKYQNQYIKIAKELSEKRKINSEKLSKEITKQLCDLGFVESEFFIEIITNENQSVWSLNGIDKTRFLAKTNKGMNPDSISKIASGGEISRFMLAFKTALINSKQSGLIVFDEIDQGIGGQTAIALANKLQELSQKAQILLITHQATIAAKANLHIKIYKESQSNITTTNLQILNKNDRIAEIARMLFGESQSKESLKSAEKLLLI